MFYFLFPVISKRWNQKCKNGISGNVSADSLRNNDSDAIEDSIKSFERKERKGCGD
jgi:hypothetical protein